MKSRWASARIAEASLTGAAHDLEVSVLEARRVGLHDAERCLDAPEDRMDRVSVQLDLKGRAATRRVTESREFVAQSRSVGLVDEHGLLEIVRGQEDRGAARPPDRGEVLPEGAPRWDVEAGCRLVEEQDLRVMQQAPHDLELPSHAAGEGLHRLVDVARNPKELRELLHLRAITAGHEPIGRRVREDAVEDRVEADVLLGR